MAKSLFLVACVLVLVPLSLAAEEPRKALASDPKIGEENQTGGFVPIENINDPYIQNLGQFAVDEHNNQVHTHLIFQEVYNGTLQIVQGINYNLKLSALDGIVSRNYSALVFVDIHNKNELVEFCGTWRNSNSFSALLGIY